MKQHLTIFSVLLTTVITAPGALASPVSIVSNSFSVGATDDTDPAFPLPVLQSYADTTFPVMQMLTANSGENSNTNNISYSGDVNSVTMSVDMDHVVNNAGGFNVTGCCDSVFSFGDIFFTANTNSSYSINGFYDSLNLDEAIAYFEVKLFDVTAGVTLYEEITESRDTMSSTSFLLDGLADGNSLNSVMGSLTGDLIAGYDYQLTFLAALGQSETLPDADAFVSARGNVTLAITPVVIPVPAAVWLFGSGLIGLIGVVRKKARV